MRFSKLLALLAILWLTPAGAQLLTTGIGGIAGGGGGGAQPARPVATRAIVGQAFVSGVPAGDIQGQSRYIYYFAGAPVTDVSVCYGNWAGPGETPGAANITIDVGLELPFPAGTKPFTWNGNSSVTLTPGQLACSDFLPASSFSTAFYPFSAYGANSPAWYRTNIVASNITNFPSSYAPNSLSCPTVAGGNACTPLEQAIAAPVFTSQSTGSGALTTPAGGSAVPAMTTPFAIIGHFAPGNTMPGLCGLGDSLMAGINDGTRLIVGKGFFNQVSYGTDGNQLWPTINLGIGGDGALSSYATRSSFYKYCTTMDMSQGSNDIVAGQTPSAIISNITARSAAISAAGASAIFQNYVIARTTAAAPTGWVNAASQTSVIEPNEDTLNGLITSSIGTAGLNGALDFTSAMGSGGTDLTKWFGDGVTYTPNVTVVSGTNSWTFSTGTFASTDVGKQIYIPGAGAAGAALTTTISTVSSTTAITTAANAGTSLTAAAEQVVYGTASLCTADGIHPTTFCTLRMAPIFNAAVTGQGVQLPSRDISWVKPGADYDFDFQHGLFFGTNPQQFFDFPNTAASGTGITRNSFEYGPTTTTSAAKLPQFGPNKGRIIPGRGLMMEKAATNLAASPFAPATQTITVINATQYTASIVGPGSMVLSGAGTGTVSAGSPVTFTSSGTSLTATISGAPLAMQVETGAIATSPTTGTRPAEQVGFIGGNVLSGAATGTQGSTVVTAEGNPTNGPIWGAFSVQYMERASATTITTNALATLSATTGTGSNGHTVLGQGWASNGREMCGNGNASASDANTSFGAVGQLYLGGRGAAGGSSLLGSGSAVIQRITHYPSRFGNGGIVSCQTATAP